MTTYEVIHDNGHRTTDNVLQPTVA